MTTLLSLVETLARDPEAKADYAAEPDAYLGRHGFGDLSPAEVNEAVLHSANTLPPVIAAQVSPSDGLASVAEVDPTSLETGAADSYEEDLFGLDDSSFEPMTSLDAEQGADNLGFDDTTTQDVVDDGEDDAPSATSHPLDLQDPHDLDEPSPEVPTADSVPDAQAGDLGSPLDQSGHEDALTEFDSSDDDLDDGLDDGLHDIPPPADDSGSGMVPLDDPFDAEAAFGQNSDTDWYQEDATGALGTTSYDVEIPEDDTDILDDVDNIDFDGS